MFQIAELYFPDGLVVINIGEEYLGVEVTGINIDNERPEYVIITTGNLHHRLKPISAKLLQKNVGKVNW